MWVSLSGPMRLPEKPLLKTTFQQLGRVCRPQLLHHVRAVRFNGFMADPQLLSNLAVLEAVPNQIEYLSFPICQRDEPSSFGLCQHIVPPLDLERIYS